MMARPTPCFLIGAPRSGTTWLQRLLQAHPRVCGAEESHFFTLFANPMSVADEMAAIEDRKIGPLSYMPQAEFDAALQRLWDDIFKDLYAKAPEAFVHLEKTPFHTLCLPQIARLFPDARFVYLARDSRAVASSLMHAGQNWGKDWAPGNAKSAALEWQRYTRRAMAWQKEHPERTLTLRYESVLSDTRSTLETALKFLLPKGADLEVTETLERFEENNANAKDPSGFARMRGSAGWRSELSVAQKLTVWRYTRKTMRELGYDIAPFD